MADPRGFLTTPRQLRPRRDPRARVGDWHEVYAERGLLPIISAQAGRCMDCGIPFCHNACPLGNLIPDWNDLVYRYDWRAASEALLATNNFPEFTGRLCPAPCESACVLAIDSDSVTIKNVELTIADCAWEAGFDSPSPPDRLSGRTVAVVGSGPAGLAAAQQLTRSGHTTVVYERADRIGGLLRYGIPAFRLEKHRLDRRIDQMRAEGTRFRTGATVGENPCADELLDRHDAVIIAMGATAWRELPISGRDLTGIHPAMEYLTLANRVDEGDLEASPLSAAGRNVVVVGGGDTASDCIGTALRQEALSVAQLDINPRPPDERAAEQPWPVHPKVYGVTTSQEEARAFAPPDRPADPRVHSATTVRFEGDSDGRVSTVCFAEADPADRSPQPGTERVLKAELVLLALGFSGPEPASPLIAQLGLATDAGGALARSADFATAVEGVFVAGDAGRGQSLVVWAIAEGRSAAAAVDRYLTGSTTLHAPITADDRPLAA